MKIAPNRVLLAFQSWEERKKEMEPLIRAGSADERTIARLQLDHLRKANYKLSKTGRPNEKPFVVLLHNQIGKLEKQLYPNLLLRLLLQFKDRFIDGPNYLRLQERQRALNMDGLNTQLRTSGMSGIAGRLEEHLGAEEQSICVPLDCQLGSDKRMNLDLYFEKDSYGDFQLDHLNGSLLENGKILKSQHFELSEWPNLHSLHIWGLLEGRAVKQRYMNASGDHDQCWTELGPDGIRHYDRQYPFDLRAELDKLPIVRNKEEMIGYLENGQRVSSCWKKEGRFQSIYIQADPANKSIQLFDEKHNPVTTDQLNEKAKKQVKVKKLEVPAQRIRKGVKNGHSY